MAVLLIVAIVLVVAGVSLWTLLRPSTWVLERAATFFPGVVFRVDTDEPAIALTFDDAPNPHVTPGLLRELKKSGAHATFFVIGSYARKYPELVDSIRAHGHELANHLYTDRMSAGLPDKEFIEELMRTDALIKPKGPIKWCRPGSGVITPRLIRLINKNGYTPCLATAYPVDLYVPVNLSVSQFMNNVRPGAILVLHDGGEDRQRSVEMISKILPRVREMGYEMLTLSQLSALGEPVVEKITRHQ